MSNSSSTCEVGGPEGRAPLAAARVRGCGCWHAARTRSRNRRCSADLADQLGMERDRHEVVLLDGDRVTVGLGQDRHVGADHHEGRADEDGA